MVTGMSLSAYKLVSALEFLVVYALFICRFKRRKLFALRAVFSVACLLTAVWFFPIVEYNVLWVLLCYVEMFVLSLIAAKICFKESFGNLLFCAMAAYLLKHMAYVLFSALTDVISAIANVTVVFNPYAEQGYTIPALELLIIIPAYVISYFLVYWFGYHLYAKKVHSLDELDIGSKQFILLAGVILAVAIVFSLVMQFNSRRDTVSMWIERGYGFLSCLIALSLQFSQLGEAAAREDILNVRRILAEEQKQYAALKTNMETVNIKCHDIKHLLGAFRTRANVGEEEIAEIEQAVSVLGTVAVTGNETLDMVLTEEMRRAEAENIPLSCMADGSALSFMKPSDLYSLFRNALDNAINAVSSEEPSRRFISLSVKKVNDIVVIRVENYFTGSLSVVNGLPKTTTGDTVNHGYGMLSMKTVAEKYGGTLSVDVDGECFRLNIIFTEHKE